MLDNTILANLILNEDYAKKVIPFLKDEYFFDVQSKIVFDLICNYVNRYTAFPTKEALYIDLSNKSGLNEDIYEKIQQLIAGLDTDSATKLEFLIDQTETFCQQKAMENAIRQSISILDDKTGKESPNSIPKLVQDALGVSFDASVGHDFLEDYEQRYELYHRVENKIPFDIDLLNTVTKGGVSRKTLSLFMAATGGGKSLFMCHCAANNLIQGHNVLYITLEMSEEKVAERIEANLMQVKIDSIVKLSKDEYVQRIDKIKSKTVGKLIIKEYPGASASTANFRYLLNELKQKKTFVPKIIYVDYLNIMASGRMKIGGSTSSYSYVKAIVEELRALAQEFDLPIITATQVNRSGMTNSDFGIEDTPESIGVSHTVDLMLGMITTEDLEAQGQIMFKQLKNRYGSITENKRFLVGVDKPRMKFHNVESTNNLVDDTPSVMDNTSFGERLETDLKNGKMKKKSFKGLQ